MTPSRVSSVARHLVWGPALLIGANLIDLMLATRVFVHPDPLIGALSFFIFGASTGLPCQLVLARAFPARWLDGGSPRSAITKDGRRWVVPTIAGALAAASTAAWLYALGAANPAVVFPLANLGPVLFAVAEGAKGKLRASTAAGSMLLLMAGLWIFRSPDLAALAGLTSAVVLALCIRNLASAGSETAEGYVQEGTVVRFNAMRFAWLAGTGVPLAAGFLLATSRLDESLELMRQALPVALPLHMLTMVLTFAGGFFRTSARASKAYSMTLCSAAYATPLVLTPVVALAANAVFRGLFPSVSGSANLLVGSFLVVAAVVWLASRGPGGGPPAFPQTTDNLQS